MKPRLFPVVLTIAVITSLGAWAEPRPGQNPASGGAAEESAKQKVHDADAAPAWVKELRARTLGDYFPLITLAPFQHKQAVDRVRADLRRLHAYFERDAADAGLVAATRQSVDRFADRLTYARVARGQFDRVLAMRELTLEGVIADRAAHAALKSRRPSQKIAALLGVHHLRGATLGATAQIIARGARWIGRQFTVDRDIHWSNVKPILKVLVPIGLAAVAVDHLTQSHLITGFVLGSLWGAVQAGPIAHLLNAATGWFLVPTTEFVKIWSKRRTGNAQERIKNTFNQINAKMGAEETLDQIRAATLERDDSDIADMPPDMQARAQKKLLRIYAALKNSWSRLMTDSDHDGRWLLTSLWSDEFDTMVLVNQGLRDIASLDSDVKLLLTPYRTVLVLKEDHPANARIAEAYHRMKQKLEKHDWGRDEVTPELTATIDDFVDQMRRLRVPEVEIQEILAMQRRRSELVSSVVTALAVNEARYLAFAEGNRNMPDEPRGIQRTIRRSFRLQRHVEYFKEQIQAVHRDMGLRIEKDECEELLDPAVAA